MKRTVGRWIALARRRAGDRLGSAQLVGLADAARDRRDFGGAAALYGAALQLHPAQAAIQVQCGHMNKELGRHDLAEQCYRAAQAMTPDDPDLNLQLGHFYKTLGRIGEAVDFYRRALDLSPDSVDASVELMELTGTGSIASRRRVSGRGGSEPRLESQPWVGRFNVLEFRTLSPDLGARVRSRDEALALFEAEGIDRLAPIAMDAVFDPAFYRDRTAGTDGLSDVDLYRHWLHNGLARGEPGSEAELLVSLHCPVYPAAFDWQAYGRQAPHRPGNRPHTRWSALEHLFKTGFLDGRDVPAAGPGAARLFQCLAEDLRARGRSEAAIRALTRALELGPDDGAAAETLGDLHAAMDRPDEAGRFYRQAYESGQRSLRTTLRLIEDHVRVDDFEEAYRLLGESRSRYAGEIPWIEALQKTVQAHFNAAWTESLAAHRALDPIRGSDGLAAALGRIVEAYRALDDLPARLAPALDGPIVMFSMTVVPQCRHYRVEQRLQQFDHLGIAVRAFDSTQPNEAREALVGARALIIYREPALPGTIRLILHAQALGVPVYYELDDLLFDIDHYPGPFEEGQLSFEEHMSNATGVGSYRFALKLADKAIASTQPLADRMAPLTRDKACLLIPNGLDARNAPFVEDPTAPSRGDEVFIFYGPGTRGHNVNFNTQVAPALVRVLAQRPQARLVVAGYLDLDKGLSGFSDRIVRLPFTKSIAAYWSLLSEMDINIAVLAPGAMNDCKSEIKWLEAAACSVASIVSSSATHRQVLRHGVDALLVTSADEWEASLLALIDDPGRRLAMGAEARRTAVSRYSMDAIAGRLAAAFGPATLVPATRPARKTRVLIVHVLFPPQAFGGATRVVVDNIDDLRRRHGDAVDLAVFTADFGAPNPHSRVGRYADIPVFRFAVSFHTPAVFEDASIIPFFTDVLDAFEPNLVHFHCIQLLTASIVEVTRARGVPYVVTLHDGWWLSGNQFMLDEDFFLKRTPPRVIEDADDLPALPDEARRRHSLMRLLRSAALVTAVSEGFAAYHRERTGLAIRAIPNGISPAFLGHRRPEAGRESGPVRLAHLGGWAPHKGIHLLQAALMQGRYRNLHVTVVDHRRSGGEVEEQVWGTTPVNVIGKVAQTDMLGLYDQIDVLLAPSIWPESFGLITREALACGLWVVTGRIGGIGDDVVEGENGFLIDVDGPAGLAEVLRTIDAYPALYRQPPLVRSTPRVSTDQADDLILVYRDIVRDAAARRHASADQPDPATSRRPSRQED